MAKDKIVYVCDNCGNESTKWVGKCPACGLWNTYKEIRVHNDSPKDIARQLAPSLMGIGKQKRTTPLRLSEIDTHEEQRFDMHDEEFNRVLGGGLVPGSIVLIGGEPGIGKSTLTLQTILNICDRKILYVSGEESAYQLKMRANRICATHSDNCHILCETSLENIFTQIEALVPDMVVIDSIQTISTEITDGAVGSITQVRECASALMRLAKTTNIPIILIGHINKEGTLAGPKILEHIVDTVIQFEGDRQHMYRILRSIKNRFGNTSEMGIYEMLQDGLRPVSNPSELLLIQDGDEFSGKSVCAAIEGVRPFLVEIQALVSSAAYGTPQRVATGFERQRLNMLLAVLERRVGFKIMQKDVFVNIAGGLRVTDLAMDLCVIAAILSSNIDTAIPAGWCMCGEVGLNGEVRQVNRIEQRVSEAEKIGFTHMIVPYYNFQSLNKTNRSIKLIPVRRVEEALKYAFG